ncbi:MAG: riboflavin kinase [Candidatus Levyibacteriota bacterium]
MRYQAVFWGKVKTGKKRGRKMGFPTVNQNLHKKIPEGIYISQLSYQEKVYNALTFIGAAKTFGETRIFAETYILSFHKEIYGEYATIRLIKKIRENKKFESAEKLKLQMEEDKRQAEIFFSAVEQ